MDNVRFGLAVYGGVLTALAAVGVALGVGGNLGDVFRLFQSVGAAFVCGGGLYAATGMLERRDLPLVAGVIAAVELIAFVLLVHATWSGGVGNSGRWSGTFFALALTGLFIAALRAMTDPRDAVVRAAFLGSSLCILIAVGVTIHAIWSSPSDLGSGDAKTAIAFLVLAAYGFLLTPALGRFRRAADGPAGAGPSATI